MPEISISVFSWCVRDLFAEKGSPTPLNPFKEGEREGNCCGSPSLSPSLKIHPHGRKSFNFFSWERKPLVSSPNLSFLKVKIHFVNQKVVFFSSFSHHSSCTTSMFEDLLSLTRSDLVLGRRLVQRFTNNTFYF
jgi:hypothetical protein